MSKHLTTCSNFITDEEKHNIDFYIFTNTGDKIINWNRSRMSKKYCIDKLALIKEINNMWSNVTIIDDENYNGLLYARRNIIDMISEEGCTVWLDNDVHSSTNILRNILNFWYAVRKTNKYYIITPSIMKLWDDSWNITTHPKQLMSSYEKTEMFNYYNLDKFVNIYDNDLYYRKLVNLKFGGGWFTCISNSLLKQIRIPHELGKYGWEDTYYMMLCSLLNTTKVAQINQYVMTNVIAIHEKKLFKFDERCFFDIDDTLVNKNKLEKKEVDKLVKERYKELYGKM